MALMASNANTIANQLMYFGSILPLSVSFIQSASGEEKKYDDQRKRERRNDDADE
jgi:hypothetical protein